MHIAGILGSYSSMVKAREKMEEGMFALLTDLVHASVECFCIYIVFMQL